MSNDDVLVLVPAFNEAATVETVVTQLHAEFPHVLCIDDGSTDATSDIARASGARVVRHTVNLGQGAALQTGFDYAAAHPEFRWVVTFDADGQHLVSDAVRMVEEAMASEADIVLASRFTGTTENMPRSRRLLLKGAVAFTRWTTHLDVTDAHNGLRVISTNALPSLRLRQPRMAYASELTHAISTGGLRYREVATTVRYSDYSRAKGQHNLNALNILFDLAIARLRATP